jgi:chemotaxis protein CheD|uniref:Probable chemoreceptor glutamine deamidase CheD n=1 Tax=Eubacterium cellulosolvens (strain ATCC 43171 / JCM 9499 / 6) TaxID=633697 RepID=I5ARU4_EUBC6
MKKMEMVRIADMKIAEGDTELVTYALGSCVGITFYDPALKLGALLHILLPERIGDTDSNVMKYADSGIHATMRQLEMLGFSKSRAIVKIAGGAKMFNYSESGSLPKIGDRNVESVKKTLAREGLHIAAEDVGGTTARTMMLDVSNGSVRIRSAGQQAVHL